MPCSTSYSSTNRFGPIERAEVGALAQLRRRARAIQPERMLVRRTAFEQQLGRRLALDRARRAGARPSRLRCAACERLGGTLGRFKRRAGAWAALVRPARRSSRTTGGPYSVQIDSGWNCTPHSGRLRVFDAHHDAVRRSRRSRGPPRRASRTRPASGSALPRSPGGCRRTGRSPVCLTGERRPCITVGA